MRKVFVLLFTFSVGLFLSSCDKETVRYDKLSTPDVTTLGISTPVAVYRSYDGENTYKMRYSRDNRLQSIEYDTDQREWSMCHEPLSFDYNGKKDIQNFQFNEAGCATYFEKQTNASVPRKFIMTYDEYNHLINMRDEFMDKSDEYRIYWENGRLEKIEAYYQGEYSYSLVYEYNSNIQNNDGIFFEFFMLEPFLSFSGLLGRPSNKLPTGYYTDDGQIGSYSYEVSNGRVYGIEELIEIEDVYEVYHHSYLYKGIYNN